MNLIAEKLRKMTNEELGVLYKEYLNFKLNEIIMENDFGRYVSDIGSMINVSESDKLNFGVEYLLCEISSRYFSLIQLDGGVKDRGVINMIVTTLSKYESCTTPVSEDLLLDEEKKLQTQIGKLLGKLGYKKYYIANEEAMKEDIRNICNIVLKL